MNKRKHACDVWEGMEAKPCTWNTTNSEQTLQEKKTTEVILFHLQPWLAKIIT
jgi:hypothetical protein